MRRMITFYSVFFFLGSTSALYPKLADPKLAKDLSPAYEKKLKDADTIDIYPAFKDFHIITVPGFFSDAERMIAKYKPSQGITTTQYLDARIAWIQKMGLSADLLQTPSEATVEDNAKIVAQAIEASDRRVVLISHSKGGLEIMEALLEHPELQTKIAGWVTMNSPFWGTPLADAFDSNSTLRYIIEKAFSVIGGTHRSIQNMTLAVREEYLTKRAEAIHALLTQIPFIALATWKPNLSGWDTILEPCRNYIDKRGYQNDGAVPWQSALLEESNYVLIKDVDHVSTFGMKPNVSFDRQTNLKILLQMLSEDPRFSKKKSEY